MPEQGPIKIFGHKKLELIRHLATGDHTQSELAQMYGVSEPRISQFKRENAAAIAACRAQLDDSDEFAGLWIVEKAKRVAEYQSDVERLNEAMKDALDPTGLRIKHNALLRVAEEMGQLPTKVQAQVETKIVRYVIEGVDPEAVK